MCAYKHITQSLSEKKYFVSQSFAIKNRRFEFIASDYYTLNDVPFLLGNIVKVVGYTTRNKVAKNMYMHARRCNVYVRTRPNWLI